jgi:putative transposase
MLGASIHFSIIMIDGIHMGDHLVLIALGIDFEGKKQVLGLREGDAEHGQVVRSLLRDLLDRGLEQERARLFVINGARALTLSHPKDVRLPGRDPALPDP